MRRKLRFEFFFVGGVGGIGGVGADIVVDVVY